MKKTLALTIDGKEYVALPRADYLRLVGSPDALGGAEVAADFARRSLGKSLRAAREAAGLTQAALAKKLATSQANVSGAETGTVRTGARYVARVLKACGLPTDWKAPKGARPRASARSTAS